MRFDKFTIKSQELIAEAQSLASKLNHQQIEPEHLQRVRARESAKLDAAARGVHPRDAALILGRGPSPIHNPPMFGNIASSQDVGVRCA